MIKTLTVRSLSFIIFRHKSLIMSVVASPNVPMVNPPVVQQNNTVQTKRKTNKSTIWFYLLMTLLIVAILSIAIWLIIRWYKNKKNNKVQEGFKLLTQAGFSGSDIQPELSYIESYIRSTLCLDNCNGK